MVNPVDLLIANAAELVTCAGGVKRGVEMRNMGRIGDGAVAVDGGQIVAVGETAVLLEQFTAVQTIDASGKVVCPGWVDAHTHVVYGGDRVNEFELRIQGASYMEIMAAGGGIVSTMRHTRAADEATLLAQAQARLAQMLALGSTTVEIKTGYGLDTATELKILRVIEQLAGDEHLPQVVPTFLGAHTVPPEFKESPEGYVRLLIEEMIPQVSAWYARSRFSGERLPLAIDVFCEDHAFDVAQARRILQAGQDAGMLVKIHVDQFNSLGGLAMALQLGAVSVDHLEVTPAADRARLAQSDSVAVLLPAVNFNLGLTTFAEARAMIDAGTAVALATDMNPGSAPCFSLALVMAIATRYQKLTPAEAMTAVTINAAHALGLGDRIGSLEAGKQADVLILNTPDYRNVTYQLGVNFVETVIKDGVVV